MSPPDNSAPPRFAARIGLDWGDRQHALALRPDDNSTIETSTLDHSAESVRAWLQHIEQRFGGRPVALALETSKGPLIHLFFDVPWLTVYPVHPATSARIRKAFTPSGAKDDTPDAQVLLSLLVHHLEQLRPLQPEDALTRRLDALCQLRRKSVDQRTQVGNQLRAALKGYYPQALELVGETLHSPLALDFLQRWPDLIRLKAEREFILCGDVNIAHQEIDLKNWKGNRKNSGFLPEERAWMTRLLNEAGLVDVYRQLQPTATEEAYTWSVSYTHLTLPTSDLV